MAPRLLTGTPASPGVALGAVWRLAEIDVAQDGGRAGHSSGEELERALRALSAAVSALRDVAAGLPADEAEIVEAGALMGEDPVLAESVEQAVVRDGLGAPAAILHATGRAADAIASLGDELLAARADDVRSLGRRAARIAGGREGLVAPGRDVVLVAGDIGPADVAELAGALAGVALAGGGATAHAAIVARSLGIPMVTALGEGALALADGETVVLDADRGLLVAHPPLAERDRAREQMRRRRQAAERATRRRDEPAVTRDGIRVGVLANVASPEELELGLRAGAEGVGLLRTELAFLNAVGWPDERQHAAAMAPILHGLGARAAVVRVLDFGADKSPPFLRGVALRGLELLLAHPVALADQLRALARAAQGHDVRVLLPMVDTAEQLGQARGLLVEAAGAVGATQVPPLGAMIETPAAVNHAAEIAAGADFLSIGTNDLTAATLGADRFACTNPVAHHPRVLGAIARSVNAAHHAGKAIEVCGEAASDVLMVPLLVGLGVDELSVGAARVGEVREWIRRLDATELAGLARSALTMDSAAEVEWALRELVESLRSDGAVAHAR